MHVYENAECVGFNNKSDIRKIQQCILQAIYTAIKFDSQCKYRSIVENFKVNFK